MNDRREQILQAFEDYQGGQNGFEKASSWSSDAADRRRRN
jgi:hypothetical protein